MQNCMLHFNFTVRNGPRVSRIFWLYVSLTACHCDFSHAIKKTKKKNKALWKRCCQSRPVYCNHYAENSAFYLKKSSYSKRPILRLACRRGSRQLHCAAEVFKPCVVLGGQKRTEQWLRGNTFHPTDMPPKRHRKSRKIAPPGATVTEGGCPALTRWALLHSPHAIPVNGQDDPCSASPAPREDDGSWKSCHRR